MIEYFHPGSYITHCANLQVCSTSDNANIKGMDHTHFIVFVSIYLTIIVIGMLVFLKTDYNRRSANQGPRNSIKS